MPSSSRAQKKEELLLDGRLPFLGVSVAWGVSMDRRKRPIGPALRSAKWHDNQSLDTRVARHLQIAPDRSHAVADTHAAAIAFAFGETQRREYEQQRYPRLAIIVRLAGAVGGAVIGIEPPQFDPDLGPTSGFADSILIGAGELAHMPLDPSIIRAYNERRAAPGLGKLIAFRCSCAGPQDPVPNHLEAYTGAAAVAARVAPRDSVCVATRRICETPTNELHRTAIKDLTCLLSHALRGPVALLNPAVIALTGTFAVPAVKAELELILSDDRTLGDPPPVEFVARSAASPNGAGVVVDGAEPEQFTRARGAALLVFRRRVYRCLPELIGDRAGVTTQNVSELTSRLDAVPWR